jgi:hypothetical protein
MTTHQTSLGGLNMTNLLVQAVVPSDPSYRFIPLTKGKYTVVSTSRFDWLNQWQWFAQWDSTTKSFYAMRNIPSAKRKQTMLSMAAAIVGPRRGKFADHISGNTLDNRDENLREATKRQNAVNRRLKTTNTSGFTGVSWNKQNKMWSAQICIGGRQKSLGYFTTKEEAVATRLNAQEKHYKTFNRQLSEIPPLPIPRPGELGSRALHPKNTVGFRHITQIRADQYYCVRFSRNGVYYYFGRFRYLNEAVAARDRAYLDMGLA